MIGKSNNIPNPLSIKSLVIGPVGNRIFKYKPPLIGCQSCSGLRQYPFLQMCKGTFALCAGAICTPSLNSPGNYICKCITLNGCNVATPVDYNGKKINCQSLQSQGNVVYSTYSSYNILKRNFSSVVVSGNGNWTTVGCMGAKCINNGDGTSNCFCGGQIAKPGEKILLWLQGTPEEKQQQLKNIVSGQMVTSNASAGWVPIQSSIKDCFYNDRLTK